MKIGIATIHNHYNYGALLQAYALNFFLNQNGHDSEIIDCQIDPGHPRRFNSRLRLLSFLKNCHLALIQGQEKRRIARLEQFRREQFRLSARQYSSIADFAATPSEYNCLLTGSDQVWNPAKLNREISKFYYLEFENKIKCTRGAYASSFGRAEISDSDLSRIKNKLEHYDFLSAREQSGQETIKRLLGINVPHVVDPTFLLNAHDYARLAAPRQIVGDYVLVYPMELGNQNAFFHLVREVKRQTKLQIVIVFPDYFSLRWLLIRGKHVFDAGVSEFISLIKHAKYVCTNSFHGICFSLIHEKPFLSVSHSLNAARAASLLGRLGLADKLIDEAPKEINLVNRFKFDSLLVKTRLNDDIESSKRFLLKSLERAPKFLTVC